MKTGLSKREKVLVFIAAAALVGYVGFTYVIRPYYNDFTAAQSELESLTMEKLQTELKLAAAEIIRQDRQTAEERLADIRSRYPSELSGFEVDRILTALCIENGMTPVTLGISDPRPAAPLNPQDGENTGAGSPAFLVVTASMTLRGEYDSFLRLIDRAAEIEYLRVVGAAYSSGGSTGFAGHSNSSLTFELTMLGGLVP